MYIDNKKTYEICMLNANRNWLGGECMLRLTSGEVLGEMTLPVVSFMISRLADICEGRGKNGPTHTRGRFSIHPASLETVLRPTGLPRPSPPPWAAEAPHVVRIVLAPAGPPSRTAVTIRADNACLHLVFITCKM